jgi:hypothetical protein
MFPELTHKDSPQRDEYSKSGLKITQIMEAFTSLFFTCGRFFFLKIFKSKLKKRDVYHRKLLKNWPNHGNIETYYLQAKDEGFESFSIHGKNEIFKTKPCKY